MKKEKKELRDLLLGKAVLNEDGKLITPASGVFRVPQGVTNGAGAVRFLGISGKKRLYETDMDEERLMEEARKCMANIGRGVRLRQQPDAVACLIRYVLTVPALLTFQCVEGRGLLTAWSGRGVTGRFSRWRAIRAFESPMADFLRLSLEEAPPEEKEEKKRRKKRREAPEEEAPAAPETEAYDEGAYSGGEDYDAGYDGDGYYDDGETWDETAEYGDGENYGETAAYDDGEAWEDDGYDGDTETYDDPETGEDDRA